VNPIFDDICKLLFVGPSFLTWNTTSVTRWGENCKNYWRKKCL